MHNMRVTLSIPDAVARKFQSAVPQRQRSRLVTSLLVEELRRREGDLAQACLAANRDKALEMEVGDWQSFDDRIEE
jgi:metal-responsive CopG/Arc/MetJ family transcriptional regulator